MMFAAGSARPESAWESGPGPGPAQSAPVRTQARPDPTLFRQPRLPIVVDHVHCRTDANSIGHHLASEYPSPPDHGGRAFGAIAEQVRDVLPGRPRRQAGPRQVPLVRGPRSSGRSPRMRVMRPGPARRPSANHGRAYHASRTFSRRARHSHLRDRHQHVLGMSRLVLRALGHHAALQSGSGPAFCRPARRLASARAACQCWRSATTCRRRRACSM
jgi:hypothetical protein